MQAASSVICEKSTPEPMTPEKRIEVLAQGISGAVEALTRMCGAVAEIDPMPEQLLVAAERLGLHGVKIWPLYHRLCDCDARKMAAVVRGYGLGFTDKQLLHASLDAVAAGKPWSFDVDDIVRKVAEALPAYKGIVPSDATKSAPVHKAQACERA